MQADILFREHKLHVARLKYLDTALGEDRLYELAGEQRSDLEQQRREQLRHMQLYDAAMSCLTSKEQWLVKQIYGDEHSLAKLTVDSRSPFYQCAKSTVWRFKERMLLKADAFLRSLETPPF